MVTSSVAAAIDSISVTHGSLKEIVADALRTAIFDGTLKPGDSIRERRVADSLSVSQATVREALLHLETSGLVVRLKNRATLVTQLSRVEAEERIAIRKRLESWAFIEAAGRMTSEQFVELEKRFHDLELASTENAALAVTQGDLEFHHYIWQCSGNATLYDTLDRVCAPLFAFVSFLNHRCPDFEKFVIHEHRKIIDALRRNDPAEITEIVSHHIDLGYERGHDAHLAYGYV